MEMDGLVSGGEWLDDGLDEGVKFPSHTRPPVRAERRRQT